MPVPLAPEEMVTQLTPLLAVQLQPLPAVTPTLPGPPAAPNDAVDPASANVHDAPLWVTL